MKTFREFISESYESHSTLMHIADHDYEQLSNVVHKHLSKFMPSKEIKNKNYIDNLFYIYNAGDRTPKEVFSYILHTSEHESKITRDSFMKDLDVARNFSQSAVESRARGKKQTLLKAANNSTGRKKTLLKAANNSTLKPKPNKWYNI